VKAYVGKGQVYAHHRASGTRFKSLYSPEFDQGNVGISVGTAAHDISHPLRPWAGDGESLAPPGMLDARFGKPVVREPRHTVQVMPSRWLCRLSDRCQEAC
jgi:hypothetical protein